MTFRSVIVMLMLSQSANAATIMFKAKTTLQAPPVQIQPAPAPKVEEPKVSEKAREPARATETARKETAKPGKKSGSCSGSVSALGAALKGNLAGGWRGRSGTGFAMSTSGDGVTVTLNSLPPRAIAALAAAAAKSQPGITAEHVAGAISSGAIAFSGSMCQNDGNFRLKLAGTGMAAGKFGSLTLIPNGTSLRVSGSIAGQGISETFTRR